MAKVQFTLAGNSMGEYALATERVTIGRRPSNDIHIDNLAVSGEHAVIVTIGNDSFLEDLNSTNGTLVNNVPIKKHVLNHGDLIELGKFQLKYINEQQGKSAGNTSNSLENKALIQPAAVISAPVIASHQFDPSATAPIQAYVASEVVKAAPSLAAAVSQSPQAPVSASSSPQITAKLQVLNGTSAGRELILNKAMTTLGKPGGQVAVVTKRPNGYFITHVGGESLPAVNGQMIGVQAHVLADNDVIELAGLKMKFSIA